MPRTITVKGTGTVSAKPDQIEITMNLSVLDKDYAAAAETAGQRTDALRGAVLAAGFAGDDLKTTHFNVNTEYRGVHDPSTGEYRQEFAGYRVSHGLLLTFPLDLAKLGELLDGVSEAGAEPELNVRFTLKDPETFREAALEAAAANARKKAEILASASGVKLGALQSIQYEWADVRLESATMFDTANYGAAPRMMAKASFAADMTPQDITFTDNAGFVWEIG